MNHCFTIPGNEIAALTWFGRQNCNICFAHTAGRAIFHRMSAALSASNANLNQVRADFALAWFCVRSQPKHEHIAAAHLGRFDDVEVFNPRIRFTRSTRKGPVWVTDSLFPNYLFARFNWKSSLSKVRYSAGVSNVVHFGLKWPTVPDEAIEELRRTLGKDHVHEIPPVTVGDTVDISGGAFHGLQGVVTRLMPAKERVKVLLDFLGRQTMIEVPVKSLVKNPTF
jgi:transcriptional antiterminator RfaH